jgi:hypothetical protein
VSPLAQGRPSPWALAALGATPLVPLVGLLPAGRWILPLVAPLALWPSFAPAVRAGRYGDAFAAALGWAVLLSAGEILLTQLAPRAAADALLNAEPYRREMFAWIESGIGKENEPARFLPEHALHLGGFALLTWASGGYLGLALGAALVGYMSYFVGSFAASAGAPLLGSLVAWVPWSVVRVAAFVALGCVLARPRLVRPTPRFGRREKTWIAAALLGIVADVTLKSALAPAYGRFLRGWLLGG